MIKAIINWFKNYYNKEIDYTFELEFSIYDVLLLLVLVFVVYKIA
ncbi:hypothetical protein [Flavobacterium davisii]